MPYQPNKRKADTTNRHTWHSFEACCAAYERGGFDGIGYVFDGSVGPDGFTYTGIDLDGCIDDNGVQPLDRERVERLDTYTELSPSGKGLHIIARAEPLERSIKFNGIEIYCTVRFFTFTGRSLSQKQNIKAAPAEVRALFEETRAAQRAARGNPQPTRLRVSKLPRRSLTSIQGA